MGVEATVMPTGHLDMLTGDIQQFDEAVRNQLCPYLNQLGELALEQVRASQEAVDSGDLDTLAAMAASLATNQKSVKKEEMPHDAIPESSHQIDDKLEQQAVELTMIQAAEGLNVARAREIRLQESIHDDAVVQIESVLADEMQQHTLEATLQDMPEVEPAVIPESVVEAVAETVEATETVVELSETPVLVQSAVVLLEGKELEISDVEEPVEVKIVVVQDHISEVFEANESPESGLDNAEVYTNADIEASELITEQDAPFEAPEIFEEAAEQPLDATVLVDEVVVTELVEPAEVVLAAVETPVPPVHEQLEELIQETVPPEQVIAAQAVLEQIRKVILSEAETVETIVAGAALLDIGTGEVEFSPELEELVEELTRLMGEIDPETVRELIGQLKLEIVAEAEEANTGWLDDGMHEVLADNVSPSSASDESILHALLGRLAMIRPLVA
jgi:hypothetical protein